MNEYLISKKELEYDDYIKNHLSNIKKASEIVKQKWIIGTNLERFLADYSVCCMSHDASKYSDEEFDAYRKHFHSINDEEKKNSQKEFDKAWEHHYTNNKHHWEYWVDRSVGIAARIPMLYILEMITDWMAMSLNFHTSLYDWYYTNKEIILHPETKEIVEKFINDTKDMKF